MAVKLDTLHYDSAMITITDLQYPSSGEANGCHPAMDGEWLSPKIIGG
ncbi:MAG: hypothetical protein ACYCT2_08245 [Thermoplasmataceae archaeon]